MWFLSSQGWFYAAFNIQPLVIYRTVIKTQLCSYFWQLPCIVLAASPTRYLLLSNTLWGSRLPFAWYSWTPMLYQLIQMSSLGSSRQPHLTHSSFEMCQVIWRVASKWNTKLQGLTNLWQKVSGQALLSLYPPFFFFFFDKRLQAIIGAFSEVWHAEVDTLDVHFARESEKCESLEHYEKSLAFRLQF